MQRRLFHFPTNILIQSANVFTMLKLSQPSALHVPSNSILILMQNYFIVNDTKASVKREAEKEEEKIDWKFFKSTCAKIFSWKKSFRKLFALSLASSLENIKNEENNKNKQCIKMPLRERARNILLLSRRKLRGASKEKLSFQGGTQEQLIALLKRERKTICMSIEF